MNNYAIMNYLRHSAGPKIDNWGPIGSDEFKKSKHDYNAGYYQRNKELWNKSKEKSKNRLSEISDTVTTYYNVLNDMQRVIKKQSQNAADLRQKYKEHGGQSEIRDIVDLGIYQLKTLVNTVKYNYLNSVATGASSMKGYKVLKSITNSVSTVITKVDNLWSSGMKSIAKLFA